MVAERVTLADGVLAEAVRRLVEALDPERIYLFGSRGRGDATVDSDYDLYVLVRNVDMPLRDQERAAYRALSDLKVAKDILIQTSVAFERNLSVVGSLPAAVEREGRLLYGERPARRVWDQTEVEGQKANLTRSWLVRAKQDLRTAARVAEVPAIQETVLYHCQQAYEKALKGFLVWHDWPLRKTHLLPELIEECETIDPEFAQLARSAAVVSPYAWKFRYPITDAHGVLIEIEPSDEDAAEALRFAREAFDFVVRRLPPEARPSG